MIHVNARTNARIVMRCAQDLRGSWKTTNPVRAGREDAPGKKARVELGRMLARVST